MRNTWVRSLLTVLKADRNHFVKAVMRFHKGRNLYVYQSLCVSQSVSPGITAMVDCTLKTDFLPSSLSLSLCLSISVRLCLSVCLSVCLSLCLSLSLCLCLSVSVCLSVSLRAMVPLKCTSYLSHLLWHLADGVIFSGQFQTALVQSLLASVA